MLISRRTFIKAGALAAIVAGISLKPGLLVFAQEPSVALPTSDPLSNFTQATFEQYLNSIFTLRGRTPVEITLTKVEDTLPAKVSRTAGRESFTLHFVGGGVALPQDTYVIDHAALGTFKLFLVPAGSDDNGAQRYVAVINRLAYDASAPVPGNPRKPLIRKPSTTTAPSDNKAGQSPTPTTPVKPTRKRKGNSDL
jgi:Domain of unknown function (DUF6916)